MNVLKEYEIKRVDKMGKREFKPGCMLAPVPAALISCIDKEGKDNLITLAWVGTINSEPPMVSISVRESRYSYHMIEETGEFVINLVTEDMAKMVDKCGVISGANVDKWKESGFTREKARKIKTPLVKESPVNIECKVTESKNLGSHVMFLAEVVAVDVDDSYFDEKDRFNMDDMGLVAFCHGSYMSLSSVLGTFGYSVKKK